MRLVILILLTLAGIFIEGTLAPLPLGLVGVILMGSEQDLKAKLFLNLKLGFFLTAGVFADILLIRPLGLTAGIYLAVTILLRMYSRKIETERLRYLLPFTGIVAGLYSWYFYREWESQVAVSLAIVIVVRFITGIRRKEYGKLKLT